MNNYNYSVEELYDVNRQRKMLILFSYMCLVLSATIVMFPISLILGLIVLKKIRNNKNSISSKIYSVPLLLHSRIIVLSSFLLPFFQCFIIVVLLGLPMIKTRVFVFKKNLTNKIDNIESERSEMENKINNLKDQEKVQVLKMELIALNNNKNQGDENNRKKVQTQIEIKEKELKLIEEKLKK